MSYLPYKNLGKVLTISTEFKGGISPEEVSESDEGTTYLFDTTELNEPFKVRVSTLIPDTLKNYAHPEDTTFPFKVLCRVHSNDGMTRSSIEMVKQETDFYEVSIEIDPERIQFRLTLQVIIIRSLTIRPKNNLNFATMETSKIAWSTLDRIIFHKEEFFKGGFLDIKWVDFESSSRVPLSAKKAMFHLNTNGEKPSILLNSRASDKFKMLVDSSSNSPDWKIPKNVILRSIASDVYKELFNISAKHCFEYAYDHGFAEFSAIEDEWQKETIKKIVPLIYSNVLPEIAYDNFFDDMRDESQFGLILEQAKLAVQISMEGLSFSEQLAETVYDRNE